MAAADKTPPTKQLGQENQTASDDFVPRQEAAVARGANPAEVVSARPQPGPGQQVAIARHGEAGKPLPKFEGETKTIVTTVTVHAPTEDHIPAKLAPNGVAEYGHYSAWEIPPGNPVTLPAAEADRILARFGGREVQPGENPPKAAPDRLNDRGPEGKTAENPPSKPSEPGPADPFTTAPSP